MFSSSGECGIGAVVPWAGKLWMITYPPHEPRGGRDKLYAVDSQMNVEIRPESVGGTHACRMIHRESKQLIIGPYFIDAQGRVRAADVHKLVGRLTAVARHLTDPAHKVYFYDMEGAVYEVDVHSLGGDRAVRQAGAGLARQRGLHGPGAAGDRQQRRGARARTAKLPGARGAQKPRGRRRAGRVGRPPVAGRRPAAIHRSHRPGRDLRLARRKKSAYGASAGIAVR